jgi:hypothetical protein
VVIVRGPKADFDDFDKTAELWAQSQSSWMRFLSAKEPPPHWRGDGSRHATSRRFSNHGCRTK